jgi:ArsR family transcriptional regulator
MNNFTKVMKALSEPNRVKILKVLQRRALCVCEIRAVLRIAQPTVSKHLRILEDAGLVTCQKDGLWANYRLADGSNTPYAASLLGNLKHWLEDVPEVAQVLKKAATVTRKEL